MSEKMRNEFEAAYQKAFDGLITYPGNCFNKDHDGMYYSANVRAAWWAWQAALDSVVVELPVIIDKEWACTKNECSAMRDAIRFCAQNIRAAGVKTR